MQRTNELSKQGNNQTHIQALDVICTILWPIMVLSQLNYAWPMRVLCAPNDKANRKALAHACNVQTNRVSKVTNKHRYPKADTDFEIEI